MSYPDGIPFEVLMTRIPQSETSPFSMMPVERLAPDPDLALHVILALMEGPTEAESAAGSSSSFGGSQTDLSQCGGEPFVLTIDDGFAHVRFCRYPTPESMWGIAQTSGPMVQTLLRLPGIDDVGLFDASGQGCILDYGGSGWCFENVDVGEAFTLSPGQRVTVAGALGVRFEGVDGDSRCPRDVTCIRAGEAFVKLTLLEADATTLTLEVPPGGGAEGSVEGWTVTVQQLAPEPLSTRPIKPSDYEATIVITRG